MRLCLITPTRGRPEAFSLLEAWMARQTACWHEWAVCNDGPPYHYTMGQRVVSRPRDGNGHQSQARNILAALTTLPPCDAYAVIEDDDYYGPTYLESIMRMLASNELVGDGPARYYHVPARRYRVSRVARRASLAQTAFRSSLLGKFQSSCLREPDLIDLDFWKTAGRCRRVTRQSGQHVSLKGLPGEAGITSQHRPAMGRPDRGMRIFREWEIPEVYREFMP